MRCLSRWTCVVMVVVSATVFAQQITGSIRGTVVDASGVWRNVRRADRKRSQLLQNTFDVSGSLDWVKGHHDLKFGGGFRRDQINALQGIASNGTIAKPQIFKVVAELRS